MQNIIISNLTFGYDTNNTIFENINLNINSNWRLGITGRNGQGKTTLFNLLLGNLEYSGSISNSIQFISFPLQIDDQQTVAQIISSYLDYSEAWKVSVEFRQLGIDYELGHRVYNTLSGGEQTKLMLAIIFSLDNTFLLIDEPTNHLDQVGRNQLSKYLKTKTGYLVISHDIYFLDQCIDHVLAIEKKSIKLYKMTMSDYLSQKQTFDNAARAKNDKLRGEITRLTKASMQTAKWSEQKENSKYNQKDRDGKPDRGYVGHKAAKLMKKSKVIEQRYTDQINQKQNLLSNIDIARQLKVNPLSNTRPLIRIDKISIEYGDGILFVPITVEVMSGEIYRITGNNGVGKTSLIKRLVNGRQFTTGSISYHSNLIISTIDQLDIEYKGNLKEYCFDNQLDVTKITTCLINMGMTREQVATNLKGWSNGQLKKLQIAQSISLDAHLYIWDEPLNYLDIITREQIKQLIIANNLTLIIIEHDEYFFDELDHQVIELVNHL